MRFQFFHIALITIALSSSLAHAQEDTIPDPVPAIPSLSASQVTRLNEGEVLVSIANGDIPIAEMMGIVEAPMDRVFDVIYDFDSYEEVMPNFLLAEVVGTEGNTRLLHGITDTPWPMEDREYTFRAITGTQTIDGVDVTVNSWDMVPESGNIIDSEGYWMLMPWGEGGSSTFIRYYVSADVGSWLPDFILEWGTEVMLPGIIEAIREHV